MNKEFWNERYKDEEYAYGTEPNQFFRQTLDKYQATGKIILPAEGEGRNAVYAAKKGLDVFAFDISIEGKNKAEKLAIQNQVQIHYEVGDIDSVSFIPNSYDVAALLFAHLPTKDSHRFHKKVADQVKPNGLLLFEAFSRNHIDYQEKNPEIGGPKSLDLLFTKDQIESDFSDFNILYLEEKEVFLREGKFHNGLGMVVRCIGQKKVPTD